jgi:hypothetical protein
VVSFTVPVSAPVEDDWAPKFGAKNRKATKSSHAHFACFNVIGCLHVTDLLGFVLGLVVRISNLPTLLAPHK